MHPLPYCFLGHLDYNIPVLSIRLLGPPQLLHEGHALELPRRKNRALLYYLAAHDQPLTRDQLLAFFWIDHERAAAQQSLRTTLYDLRKHVGDALIVEGEAVALGADAEVDVRAFTSAIHSLISSQQSLISSLSLYRGDFLDGFTIPDPPEFDDWVTAERERYRTLAQRGWQTLAELYRAQRAYGDALNALERALSFEPLDEELQQAAMRIQYWKGDRAGAIRRFDQLRQRLDRELGVPPLPETRAVYDAIITDQLPVGPPETTQARPSSIPLAPAQPPRDARPEPSTLLPLIGRDQELSKLEAINATGKLIWIEGEAGIGKTRLAEEFIARLEGSPGAGLRPAPGDGVRVLRGAAHELEQSLPYQPLIDALRGFFGSREWTARKERFRLAPIWIAELARLVPELSSLFVPLPPTTAFADESRLWEALHQFVLDLARSERVVLFIDDLHWADAATLGVIGYLARRAGHSGLILIITARPAELTAAAALLKQTLGREGRLASIEPSLLSSADLQVLTQELSPAHSDELAEWLNRNAEGNPFFINELVRYAYDNAVLTREGALDPQALTKVTTLTPTIQNLILSRFGRLDQEARRVLQTASVIGREFELSLLARAADLSENETLNTIETLNRAGLVRAQGGETFTFDHHLTLQVAWQDAGAARRRVLDRRIAKALTELHHARLDPVAGLIARHLTDGGLPPRAAPFALRAGDYASTLAAWAEAITFYQQSLPDLEDDAQRTRALLGLARGHLHKGDMAGASALFYDALALARKIGDIPQIEAALVGQNQSFMPQSRFAEAITVAQEIRDTGIAELQLAAEFSLGTARNVEGIQPHLAEQHLRAAEQLFDAPRPFTSVVTRAMLKYQLGGVLGQQGKFQEAIGLYWEALNLVRADPTALDLQRHILLYNNLAYYLHLVNDPSAAEYARAGLQLARDKGTLTHQTFLLSTSGEIALAQNELDAAEGFFKEGLRVATGLGIPERIVGTKANWALVAKARGDNPTARARLLEALAEADHLKAQHLATRIRIWIAPLLTQDEARAQLEVARTTAVASGFQGLVREIERVEAELFPR